MMTIEGVVDLNTIENFAKEVIPELQARDCKKVFNDLRKINLKLSTTDIYYLPQILMKMGLDPLCKRAILVDEHFDDVAFFQLASTNIGQNVKVFKNPDDAMNWLNS